MRQFIKTFFASLKKELIIFTRYKVDFFMSLYWPFIYPLYLIFLAKGMAGPSNEGISHFQALAKTTDYTSFMVIGAILWMFVNFNLWSGGLSLYNERIRGTFETQWASPAPKIGIILGNTFSQLVTTVIPMFIVTYIYKVIGFVYIKGNILNIVIALFVSFPFLLGFLLMFSSLTIRIRNPSYLVQIVRSLLTLLCGFQFPFAILPKFLQTIGNYIPLKHTIDIFRGVLMQDKPLFELRKSINFMLISGFLFLLIGILSYILINKDIKKRGLTVGY